MDSKSERLSAEQIASMSDEALALDLIALASEISRRNGKMRTREQMAAIPYEQLASELGRRNAARRVGAQRKGAPRKPTPCPRCGVLCPSARGARSHDCKPADLKKAKAARELARLS